MPFDGLWHSMARPQATCLWRFSSTHLEIPYAGSGNHKKPDFVVRLFFLAAKTCFLCSQKHGRTAHFFFSSSRISVSSFSVAVGSGVGAGASSFFLASLLMPLTSKNTQKAMMMKSMKVCMKLP